jgi:hypothetical protein
MAVECPKTHEEMIHTSSSEVGVTEEVLGELMKHLEEMEAGWGQCRRYIKPQTSQIMIA